MNQRLTVLNVNCKSVAIMVRDDCPKCGLQSYDEDQAWAAQHILEKEGLAGRVKSASFW